MSGKTAIGPMDSAKPNQPTKSVRLNKALADAGLGSRRQVESIIRDGRVVVDGEPVTDFFVRVDLATQDVQVDGKRLQGRALVHILLNKPVDVVCTSKDPEGRTTCIDLLPGVDGRVYTVGRLDLNSTGLILLTNDGDLAHRLMHPRYHIEKIYRVLLDSPLTPHQLRRLRRGIRDDGEVLKALSVRPKGQGWVEFRLGEGRNRHIRRMVDGVGRKVVKLDRIRIGPLTDSKLRPGGWRYLAPAEVALLRDAVGLR